LHVGHVAHSQSLSGDISQTNQTRGRFDMRVFCRSLKRREQSPVEAEEGRGDDAAYVSRYGQLLDLLKSTSFLN
jgi:hypothetical protein